MKFRECPNRTGIGFVDYVLWGDDGRPLAVEAKNALHDPRKGGRIKQNCTPTALKTDINVAPHYILCNGYRIWIWDDKLYPPRLVAGIYSKDELEWTIQRQNKACSIRIQNQ